LALALFNHWTSFGGMTLNSTVARHPAGNLGTTLLVHTTLFAWPRESRSTRASEKAVLCAQIPAFVRLGHGPLSKASPASGSTWLSRLRPGGSICRSSASSALPDTPPARPFVRGHGRSARSCRNLMPESASSSSQRPHAAPRAAKPSAKHQPNRATRPN